MSYSSYPSSQGGLPENPLSAEHGGTGLTTAGNDTSKALMSDGAGGFVMQTPPSSGSFIYENKTASFNAQAGYAYSLDTSSNYIVVTLPDATTCEGQEITITITDGTNGIEIDTTGGQTVAGLASGEIFMPYTVNFSASYGGSAIFVSDGTNWQVHAVNSDTLFTYYGGSLAVTAQITGDSATRIDARPQVGNLVYNPTMSICQRYPNTQVGLSNGDYAVDRWYVLGDGDPNTIRLVGVTYPPDPDTFLSSFIISNMDTVNRHLGFAQIIDGSVVHQAQSTQLSFEALSGVGSAIGGATFRAALIGWTGTTDDIDFGGTSPRDPILDWTSTSYVEGDFFRTGSDWEILAVQTDSNNPVLVNIPSADYNNFIIVVWQVETFTDGGVASFSSNPARPIQLVNDVEVAGQLAKRDNRTYVEELLRCQRFYQKSYSQAVIPNDSTELGAIETAVPITIASTTSGTIPCTVRFPVPMRVPPTVTLYGTSGTSGAIRNITAGADRTGVTAGNIGDAGFNRLVVDDSSSQALTAANTVGFHFTAEAEL